MVFENLTDLDFASKVWKILIVDDVLCHRQRMIKSLKIYPVNIEFTEASTAEEAIEALASNDYDIAILDVFFPGISGLKALEKARQRGSKTFVTLVSSTIPPNYEEIGRKLRAHDYLQKPVSNEVLLSIIDSYIEVRHKKSVLIIDDSRTTRTLVRRILEASSFALTIDEAESAVEGIESYVRKKADMVMLDINMEVMGGDTALRIFNAAFPNVPVVLMSSDKGALARSKCTYKLKKPFSPNDIDSLLYTFSGLRVPFSKNNNKEQLMFSGDR